MLSATNVGLATHAGKAATYKHTTVVSCWKEKIKSFVIPRLRKRFCPEVGGSFGKRAVRAFYRVHSA